MKPVWKELKYNRRRYLFVEIIVVLMMFMVLFLSGLNEDQTVSVPEVYSMWK